MFLYIGKFSTWYMTDILSISLIITAIIYLMMMLFLRIGLEKSIPARRNEKYEPTVSVIVAARNEEQHIEKCMDSLTQLDYPSNKIEVIIVDDRSDDRTPDVIQSYTKQYPFIKMATTKPETGNLRGKTNAIAEGINSTKSEILMFTDADCIVPRTWIRATVQHFDESIGIIGGFTLLESHRIFEGVQALDWIFLFGIASATAGWNIPITAIGNNLSVRRSAYEMVGGYNNIPFSVTEDYSLVQAILQQTNYKLRFPIDHQTVVKSKACKSWSDLFRQKQRWGVGGLNMVPRGFIIMAIGWSFKISLIFGIVYSTPIIMILVALSMAIAEFRFLWRPLRQFERMKYSKYFIVFEIYFFLYSLIIPFVAFFSRKVVWKKRNFRNEINMKK
ncbi:MAG TPA: glycosyltransferase [Bacteroidota bacterium]|nr:glycosyltransferase [Bacteroidota bacterium]